jgi:hypothetical protein
MSEPLPQHNKGITDLDISALDRDMALIERASGDSIHSDLSARDVVDLSETLASLPDNGSGRCIRDGHRHKVAVGFTLLREGLS